MFSALRIFCRCSASASVVFGFVLRTDSTADEIIALDRHESDPNITPEFTEWAGHQKVDSYFRLLLESSIFTKYEISRQVHLMFTLNIMATLMRGTIIGVMAQSDTSKREQMYLQKNRPLSIKLKRLQAFSISFVFALIHSGTLNPMLLASSQSYVSLETASLQLIYLRSNYLLLRLPRVRQVTMH